VAASRIGHRFPDGKSPGRGTDTQSAADQAGSDGSINLGTGRSL
jgi:hypothetical protein